MSEIPDLSLVELSKSIAKGELSPSDVLEEVFSRIEKVEEDINAYIQLNEEGARKRAVELDSERPPGDNPLFGIPIAIKDNIVVKGLETTCGSRILLGYRPPYTATAVQRLLDKGVIVLGKTNMDEFGMGASGEYSYFGPTSNPWNIEYVPGGSSSGSAAAVAAGEAIAALGTDTGGSIRLPASFTGTVGLKPTYGRVSRYGLVAFASSLDQIGIITKNVVDSAWIFSVISGYDPMDSTSARVEVPTFEEIFDNYEKRRPKIGIPRQYFIDGLDAEIGDAISELIRKFDWEKFWIIEIELPHTKYDVAVYQLIATAEASANLARYDGVRYGHRYKAEDLEELYRRTRTEGFGDEVKRRIMLGTFALSTGYYEAYYQKAQKARRLIREDFDEAFRDVDVILAPVSPVLPFKKGEKIVDPLQLYLVDVFTTTANLAGIPSIALPLKLSKNGLPIGFQLMGRPFEEETLFRVARFYEEKLSDFDLKRVVERLNL